MVAGSYQGLAAQRELNEKEFNSITVVSLICFFDNFVCIKRITTISPFYNFAKIRFRQAQAMWNDTSTPYCTFKTGVT